LGVNGGKAPVKLILPLAVYFPVGKIEILYPQKYILKFLFLLNSNKSLMAATCSLSQTSETNNEKGKDAVIRFAKDKIYELSNELFLMKSLYAKLEQQNKELQKQVFELKTENKSLKSKELISQNSSSDFGVDNILIPDDLLPLEPPENISLNRCWCVDLSINAQ
jgi:hypothetical protein